MMMSKIIQRFILFLGFLSLIVLSFFLTSSAPSICVCHNLSTFSVSSVSLLLCLTHPLSESWSISACVPSFHHSYFPTTFFQTYSSLHLCHLSPNLCRSVKIISSFIRPRFTFIKRNLEQFFVVLTN